VQKRYHKCAGTKVHKSFVGLYPSYKVLIRSDLKQTKNISQKKFISLHKNHLICDFECAKIELNQTFSNVYNYSFMSYQKV
jgi:hypothetical protein